MSAGIFGYIFASYTALTFHRRSLTFISHILRDSKLLTTQQLGAAASLNAFVFAVTKFLSWTFVNRLGAKLLLIFALIFGGLTAFMMTMCPSFIYFFGVWALAGLAHGCSWPPCGYYIRKVCSVDHFGVWWGIISSSSNVSALVGPLLTSLLLSSLELSWKSVFIINGVICLCLAITVAKVLPSISQLKGEPSSDKGRSDSIYSLQSYSWASLFSDRAFIYLCLAYVVLSTVKFSFANWIHLCLIDSNIPLSFVVYYVTFMELGGLFGSFSSGFLAEWISKYFSTKGKGKIAILIIYTVGLLFAVHWLNSLISRTESSYSSVWWNALFTGCLIASSYSLFGMLPMEIVASQSSGRYSSVIDLAGSMGSLMAGYPISLLQSYFAWSGVLNAMQAAVAIAAICLWLAFHSLHPERQLKYQ